jgi:hypothetical protein
MKRPRALTVTFLIALAALLAGGSNGALAAAGPKHSVLLFPYVSNVAGYDTAIAIANTTDDPFGTRPEAGPCTIYYYGRTAAGTIVPAQTTSVIYAGEMVSFALSAGGVPGSPESAATFRGYVIADCSFPLARGFAWLTDVAANKIGIGLPVETLRNDRPRR